MTFNHEKKFEVLLVRFQYEKASLAQMVEHSKSEN